VSIVLIEPSDVLFFRDAIPMAAGQGKGAGCRMPFPSTMHEALRASLLRATGGLPEDKLEQGRPRGAARKGNWHDGGHDGKTFIAARAFRSLRTVGPLPWHAGKGVLLPVPLDAGFPPSRDQLWRLQLWRDASAPSAQNLGAPSDYCAPCLPVAVTPPDKHGQLTGWWTVNQYHDYLTLTPRGWARRDNSDEFFKPLPTSDLWDAEHRIGVEIEPRTFAARQGQLYAGSYLRTGSETRFAVQLDLGDRRAESSGEGEAIANLDWLLLGGEFRLARLWHRTSAGQPLPDPFAGLRAAPAPPPGEGACLLKWTLVTPAIFVHGHLPGWCADSRRDRPGGGLPVGRVCLELPGRAQLVSWCLGRPRTVSGWDVVGGHAKPTSLAVPEGGVYYFLCENRATAGALAEKLHWQPRSDFYGEKGCGYGLVSFDVLMHRTSPDVLTLAKRLFND
jgi:CRISPR-associated protein Cmr3